MATNSVAEDSSKCDECCFPFLSLLLCILGVFVSLSSLSLSLFLSFSHWSLGEEKEPDTNGIKWNVRSEDKKLVDFEERRYLSGGIITSGSFYILHGPAARVTLGQNKKQRRKREGEDKKNKQE